MRFLHQATTVARDARFDNTGDNHGQLLVRGIQFQFKLLSKHELELQLQLVHEHLQLVAKHVLQLQLVAEHLVQFELLLRCAAAAASGTPL